MENSFVVIAYNNKQAFISKIETGPFNQLTDFFYLKSEKKKLQKHLSKEEIKVLQPFDLEKYDLEIEEVEGWEDSIFLKGKRKPQSFLSVFLKFKTALPFLMANDDLAFYEKPIQQFTADLEALVNRPEVAYVTFYDLLV